MKFRETISYDASPAQVRAMLADPAFREAVCERQHVVDKTVTIDGGPEGAMTVRVDQELPAQGIPSFAKKIVGDTVEVVQEEDWDGHVADLSVTIPGKPGHLRGTVRLEESGSGTLEVVEGDVKVSIPVVGGKLEKLIGQLLASALRAEGSVGREWLSR